MKLECVSFVHCHDNGDNLDTFYPVKAKKSSPPILLLRYVAVIINARYSWSLKIVDSAIPLQNFRSPSETNILMRKAVRKATPFSTAGRLQPHKTKGTYDSKSW